MRYRFDPKDWLGGRDSNPDTQIQNLQSYRWTTSQQGGNRSLTAESGDECDRFLFYNLRPMIA
jgi:hypothetical protein